MPAESAAEALAHLRDPSSLQWYVVPLLAFVVYVYAVEIERRNWGLVFAGLAFWGMDWINEIWNGIVFYLTGYAPVWAAVGPSAFLILIGLNIEIACMFAVAGVVLTRLLPNPRVRWLGLPNRLVMAVVGSIGFVLGEIVLNAAGLIAWEHPWWSARAPWLIFLIGYLPFFAAAYWVYDLCEPRRQVRAVAVIWSLVAAGLVVFGAVLRWI